MAICTSGIPNGIPLIPDPRNSHFGNSTSLLIRWRNKSGGRQRLLLWERYSLKTHSIVNKIKKNLHCVSFDKRSTSDHQSFNKIEHFWSHEMLFATTFLGIRNAYSTYSVPGVIKALVSDNYQLKLQCWYTGTRLFISWRGSNFRCWFLWSQDCSSVRKKTNVPESTVRCSSQLPVWDTRTHSISCREIENGAPSLKWYRFVSPPHFLERVCTHTQPGRRGSQAPKPSKICRQLRWKFILEATICCFKDLLCTSGKIEVRVVYLFYICVAFSTRRPWL